MAEKRWMIYGANGYTGRITAELAVEQGERPLLAGRNAEALSSLAERLGLPWRAFSLQDARATEAALEEVDLVLHCAGPFSATSQPMVDACLRTRTSYLDITGEIPVFEAIFRRDAEAKARGVVLLPGVGFDVVPSDCLAAMLHQRLPDASELLLAFFSSGTFSPGTLKTMVEGLPRGGAIRRDGRIIPVPPAHEVREVSFPSGRRKAVSIPWGDVSTAYYSTGIPNITVYAAVPPQMILGMKASRFVAPLLGLPFVQDFLKHQVERRVKGPGEERRKAGRNELWGQVKSPTGQRVEGTLEVPEGYEFTAVSSVASVKGVLSGGVEPGAKTPSLAFGADFVTRLPGCKLDL